MSDANKPTTSPRVRHGFFSRLLHACLALAVIWQLGGSLVMHPPSRGRAGDAFFEVHEWVGLFTFGLIVCYWLFLAVRRMGADIWALFPWFSPVRLAALRDDASAQIGALARLRLPSYAERAPLASAVHGLGLLVMTAMAGTGFVWWLARPSQLAALALETHELFANLAWVYLVAHAALAVLHHVRGEASLAEMWSLRMRS